MVLFNGIVGQSANVQRQGTDDARPGSPATAILWLNAGGGPRSASLLKGQVHRARRSQCSDRLRSLTIRQVMFLVHKTTFPIKYAMTTDDTVATIPGTIKLWFTTYFPIRVVPVWSNEMAANSVAYVGRKK
jgi:hypothetical protein